MKVKEEVKEATEVKPTKFDWKDLLERAIWTFLEGFMVALPAALTLEDLDNWWAIIAPAIMAGVSAVKTLIVNLVQDMNKKN